MITWWAWSVVRRASIRLACHELHIIAHLFVWLVMNFISLWTSHLFTWSAMGVTSVRLVCHELHIIVHPFVWFVMNFVSVRLVCHELRVITHPFVWFVMNFISSRIRSSGLSWTSHPFVWFVMDFTSVRLVCHELHIYSSGLSWTSHPFVWFVMDFTSIRRVCRLPCIYSSGLSWTSHRRASIRLVCHDFHVTAYPFTWSVMTFASLCFRCVVVHGFHIHSSVTHPFTSSRIDSSGLSWFSHLLCIYSSVHGCCQVARWFVMGVVQFCHVVVVRVTGWLRRFTLRVWVSRLPGLLGLWSQVWSGVVVSSWCSFRCESSWISFVRECAGSMVCISSWISWIVVMMISVISVNSREWSSWRVVRFVAVFTCGCRVGSVLSRGCCLCHGFLGVCLFIYTFVGRDTCGLGVVCGMRVMG